MASEPVLVAPAFDFAGCLAGGDPTSVTSQRWRDQQATARRRRESKASRSHKVASKLDQLSSFTLRVLHASKSDQFLEPDLQIQDCNHR